MWTAVVGWVTSNVKWIAITAIVVASVSVLYKLYDTIQENGQSRIIIEALAEAKAT